MDKPTPPADTHADAHAGQPMPPEPAVPSPRQSRRSAPLTRARHWERTRRMTAILLTLWLLTTFCAAFFARELAGLSVFGWPLSFYLAAQGASLVYLAILIIYAWRMRKLDKEYHA